MRLSAFITSHRGFNGGDSCSQKNWRLLGKGNCERCFNLVSVCLYVEFSICACYCFKPSQEKMTSVASSTVMLPGYFTGMLGIHCFGMLLFRLIYRRNVNLKAG